MRLFIAIKSPENVRDNIQKLVRELGDHNPELRKANWVKPENLHLTLEFLGEVAEQKVKSIARSLMQTAKSYSPFTVSAQGAGAFPRRSRAHLFWAGVHDPENKLKSLAASIEKSCVSAGLAPNEKPFAPHITFARFSSPLLGVQAAKILEPHLERSFGDVAVDRFFLIHSALHPGGASYNDLREFPLSA